MIAIALATAADASDDAKRVRFAIESQPLNESLAAFAEQCDVPLVFSQPDVQSLEGNALVGEYSVQEAINILLDGTGLRGKIVGGGALSITTDWRGPSIEKVTKNEGEDVVKRGLLRSASGFALSLVGAFGAAAQNGSDEIVVEGTRFQSSLSNRLDVPKEQLVNTIDELDQDILQKLNFINFQEALTTLPGVSFADFNAATGELDLFVRGVAPTFLINNRLVPNLAPTGEGQGGSNADQSFIETFEVLKGPASIVFGPVTPGGVINQVYRSPKAEDHVNLALTGSTFGTYRVETDLNSGALFGQDWLRGRITVAYEDVKFAQELAERQVLAIRPIIEADITEQTALQLSYAYKETEGTNTSRFPLNDDGTTPELFTPRTYIGSPESRLMNESTYADGELVHNFLDNLKLTLRGAYGTVETENRYNTGGYNYSSFYGPAYGYSGYTEYNGFRTNPADPRYGLFSAYGRDASSEIFYGDAQLAGFFDLFGNRQDALIGFTRQSTDVTFIADGSFGFDRFDPEDPSTWLSDFDFDTLLIETNANYELSDVKEVLTSVYAEFYLRPVEWLTIPFGIRYDDVEQDILAFFNDGGIPTTLTETLEDDAVTIRTGLSAEVTEGINVYYSYAESFLPQTGVTRDGSAVGGRDAVNHEIGVKATIIDGMYLTAAAYRLRESNILTDEPGFFLPGEVRFSIGDGEQVFKGFEVNLAGQLTEQLSLNFGYSYTDAEITETIGLVRGGITQVPDHLLSVYSTYEFDRGPLSGFRIGGGVRHVGERLVRSFQSGSFAAGPDDPDAPFEARLTADGYTIFDLILGYEINDTWDLQVNVQNLTDERYFIQPGYSEYSGGWKFGPPINALFTLRANY